MDRTILILTAEQEIARSLTGFLSSENHAEPVTRPEEAFLMLQKRVFDILFLDLEIAATLSKKLDSVKTYESVLKLFWEHQPTLIIVIMSSGDRIRDAVKAVKAGANNFITYPFQREEVQLLIQEVYEERVFQSELKHLRDQFWAADAKDDVNTQSDAMKLILDQIKSVAPTKSTVLLSGETGTGKTRLAKLIHRHSSRKEGPFISINCGAIPDTLLESELFGHEKGAFTGAIRLKLGKFEISKGGTLFLDEIGTISQAAQVKLLTVIQDNEFQRVGGEATIPTDVRLIAASNMNLTQLVEEEEFRKDLYYRLNVFPITVPRLEERQEDIPNLVEALIAKYNLMNAKSIKGINSFVLTALQQYSWPGNIRELENVIERAHILETTDVLTAESFPQEIVTIADTTSTVALDFSVPLADVRRQVVDDAERQYLKDLLERNTGKISVAAEEAGISPRQLNKLLHKYAIRKEDYKKRK
jgi:DNA-binding NtrC family response regulator